MKTITADNFVKYIKSDNLSFTHGFSTRVGGVSTGIFDSLNLGMRRGDDKDSVITNYHRFFDSLGIKDYHFVCGDQVHGNYVHIVEDSDIRLPYEAYEGGHALEADGFATNKPGVPLVVFTADCVPVLMEDSDNGVIAAVHCGWRSTVADIESSAINAMVKLGANPSNIHIAIGPAICENCFQVGAEVIDAVEKLLGSKQSDGTGQADTEESSGSVAVKDVTSETAESSVAMKDSSSDIVRELAGDQANKVDEHMDVCTLYRQDTSCEGKYLLNLREVVKRRFIQLGVKEGNIDIANECTMCQPDLFWSHRYTGGVRGSQANMIVLRS